MAAGRAPTPRASIMKPSWLIVEYARTRFISVITRAMVAAKRAVPAPM